MADLSEALVDRTMAIAMPSGLHVPAVAEQECVVDCKLSAEKQRSLYVGASDDQSLGPSIDQASIQASNAALLVCREQRKRWLGSCLHCTIHTKNSRPSFTLN
jgi:hypothetical protein